MSQITNVKLPDNNVYNLRASALRYVTGTGTAAKTSSPYISAKWEADIDDISEYYDGLTIVYKVPVAGNGSYGTVLQINSLGYHPVLRAVNSMVSTRYAVNATVALVYNSSISGAFYNNSASATTVQGAWMVVNDIDNDTTASRGYNDYYLRAYAGSALYRYKLCMLGENNRMYPIVTTDQSSTTQVTKAVQTANLKPHKIWLYNATTTVSAGSVIGAQTLYPAMYLAGSGYSFNTNVPTYRMIYLCGSYNKATDLFKLDNSTTSSYFVYVPTNASSINLASYFSSGKYYILVGASYSTANYFSLFDNNPMYYFDGTNLIPVSTKIANDVAADIPTNTSDLTNDSNFVSDASYVHTDNNYTTTEKNKLSGIAAGAQVNQNAFSNVRVGSIVVPALGTTDTLEIDASGGISITADVSEKKITFTGSGSPSPQVQSNWNETDTTSAAYIQNKPTIPSAPVQSNWNESDSSSLAYIQNKPTIPSAPVQSNWSESDSSSLAYIQNKPTIPTLTSQLDNDSGFVTLLTVEDAAANIIQMIPTGTNTVSVSEGITSVFYKVSALPDTIFALPWSQTSGQIYHPVLFDLNTGVIQLISYDHDNSEFSFITLNDNGNGSMTGYISTFTVPTKTSDLQNDSNFVVDASYVHTDNNFTTALKDSVEALANVGTVYNTSVTDVSVSSGTWKSIASLSLPKGTFLVNGNPRFGAVTNKGTRQMCLNTSSNANGTHGKVVIDFQATSGSGNVIGMQSSYIFSLSSPTTVYLNVYHTQGSALTVSAELQAVCISAGSTSYQSASGVGF